MKLSVVIPNYNYEMFVAEAIESALSIEWADLEVIVVDDGSTDSSREIISRFEKRGVKAIFQENAGPSSAANTGYLKSSGDLVLFLDSDDIVSSQLMTVISRNARDGVSKYQFQMYTIDSNGEPLGSFIPKYNGIPSSEQIRKWYEGSSAYPTPPGSGNVYTREFLEKIFPLEPNMDRASDSYTLSTAPILGDVITISEPLFGYRIHENNLAAMKKLKPEKFGIDLSRAVTRSDYARRIAEKFGAQTKPGHWSRSLKNLQLRVASYILARKQHPIPGDGRLRIIRSAIVASTVPQGNSLKTQSIIVAWVVLMALVPTSICRHLASWRYASSTRPRWMKRLLSTI